MKFLHPERDATLELALEDVFLTPGYFSGTSRLDADLRPADFPGGSHPIVSSNMNAVTGKRMAETMARVGGLGVLPQDMDLETGERIVGPILGLYLPGPSTRLCTTSARRTKTRSGRRGER